MKEQFTEDERRLIEQAAHHVWNEIAFDCVQDGEISQAEVIELVCDANRLEQQILRKNADLAKRVQDMDYKELIKLLKPTFPYKRYGL
jgi:hypothetical protein